MAQLQARCLAIYQDPERPLAETNVAGMVMSACDVVLGECRPVTTSHLQWAVNTVVREFGPDAEVPNG